jgi:hypothetical protein
VKEDIEKLSKIVVIEEDVFAGVVKGTVAGTSFEISLTEFIY